MSPSTPFQVKYPPYFDDVSNSSVDDVDLSDNSVNTSSKDGRNDIHLAERTSEILQNYRAFLQEYDLETSSTQINPSDDNLRNLQYHDHRISTHGTVTNNDVSMLRDFSMPIDHLRSSDNDRVEERRARRTVRPFLSSKGVKYGVLLGLAMLAVIVVVILSPEKSSTKNTANEVDQNHMKEAEYILEHEDVNEGESLLASTNDSPVLASSLATGNAALVTVSPTFNPTMIPTSFTDVPTYEPSSVSSSAKDLEPIENNGNSENIAAEVPSEILQMVHDKFMPLWLSSEEGWNGGAMLDAVEFCMNIGRELCPYSIMCPNGPGQSVMDGRREEDSIEGEEGEQYAPVAIVKSGAWVRVNGDETCTPHPPSLSMDVSYYEMKKHIMCCTPNVL